MISKDDLKKHLNKLLSDVTPGDMKRITQKIGEFLTYSNQNYDELDEDAKKMTDNLMETIKKCNAEILNKMPDSKIKRQMSRLHASSIGKHFDIEALLKELESPPKKIDDGLIECIKIFTEGLKHISGFIFDITQNTLKGKANFAQISLLTMCVNELLVTLHLLKHRYVNQAYCHIRIIFEHLDKVELFRRKPEWADVWAGSDEKLKWNELRPAEVRIKLGKDKYDPMYGLFSSLGIHGSFKAVQIQSARKVRKNEERHLINFWVGGNPFEHNTVWVNAFGIYAVYSVLLQTMRSFGQYIHSEEGEKILETIFTELKNYNLNYFLVWAKKVNLKTDNFKEFLDKMTWDNIEKDAK